MATSLGIKPLNLKEALELYDILGKYLPEMQDDDHILDFVGKIVDNIVEAKSSAYVDAICLMTKHSVSELLEYSSEYRLKLFTIGLTVNDVVNLKTFCKDISYD